MAVECIVSGDALEVARDGGTVSLSLALPLDRLSAWLDIGTEVGWWELHQTIRDEIMPDSQRDYVQGLEAIDALDAVLVTRDWSAALGGRLGKVLSLPSSGDSTGQLSPPTSGGDTA